VWPISKADTDNVACKRKQLYTPVLSNFYKGGGKKRILKLKHYKASCDEMSNVICRGKHRRNVYQR
jgi:hypothetical protein